MEKDVVRIGESLDIGFPPSKVRFTIIVSTTGQFNFSDQEKDARR